MAARFIANLLIMGGGIALRVFAQAYQKALQNASRNGTAQNMASGALQKARARAMTLQEARNILGVSEETPWEEVLERYKRLYENNERSGSFYLQSKVQRAKECLETGTGEAQGHASATAGASSTSGDQHVK